MKLAATLKVMLYMPKLLVVSLEIPTKGSLTVYLAGLLGVLRVGALSFLSLSNRYLTGRPTFSEDLLGAIPMRLRNTNATS